MPMSFNWYFNRLRTLIRWLKWNSENRFSRYRWHTASKHRMSSRSRGQRCGCTERPTRRNMAARCNYEEDQTFVVTAVSQQRHLSFQGYLNNPIATKNTFTPDGRFKQGMLEEEILRDTSTSSTEWKSSSSTRWMIQLNLMVSVHSLLWFFFNTGLTR